MNKLYELMGKALSRSWFDALYHTSDAVFFPDGVNQSRFANPISYHMNRASDDVVAWLFSEEDDDPYPESIEDICRIKVIQDSPKETALQPVFQLEGIVEGVLREHGMSFDELPELRNRVTSLRDYMSDRYDYYENELERIRLAELARFDAIPALRARRAQTRKEGRVR